MGTRRDQVASCEISEVHDRKHTVNGLRIHEISVSAGGAVELRVEQPRRDQVAIGREQIDQRFGFGFLDDELHRRRCIHVGDGHQRPRMSSMIAEDRVVADVRPRERSVEGAAVALRS